MAKIGHLSKECLNIYIEILFYANIYISLRSNSRHSKLPRRVASNVARSLRKRTHNYVMQATAKGSLRHILFVCTIYDIKFKHPHSHNELCMTYEELYQQNRFDHQLVQQSSRRIILCHM